MVKPKRDIPVVFYQEGDQWLAQALGVEVATFGPTLEAAKAAIQEALELFFEDDDEMVLVGAVHVETMVV
jgi:predicted RNase H-like HicB family nuclease